MPLKIKIKMLSMRQWIEYNLSSNDGAKFINYLLFNNYVTPDDLDEIASASSVLGFLTWRLENYNKQSVEE